ncbi:MAG: hypothetical protein IJK23_01255 [Clostridia bacterium]|nr:hypothetical protein [Clostridia bacterium]
MKKKFFALLIAVCILISSGFMPARAVSSLVLAACDINGDGRVASSDARIILRRAARVEYYEMTQAAIDAGIRVFGDMNGSGGVTSADARLLLKFSSRMVDESIFIFSFRETALSTTEQPSTGLSPVVTDTAPYPVNPAVPAATVSEGVNISHHNGYIDWEKMKERVDWVILRCGYGGDFAEQDDLRWEYNASRCEELGIPYGVYLYSYADSTEKAASEAEHALRLLKGRNPQLPVYYDIEEEEIARRVSKTRLLEIAKVFCEKITAAGFEFGVYANLNWWNDYLTDPWFNGHSRWMAEYRDDYVNDGRFDVWQYTVAGKIEGIDGEFSLNRAYRSFDLQLRPTRPEPGTVPGEEITVPGEVTVPGKEPIIPDEELTELVDDPPGGNGSSSSAVILSEGVDISHHNGFIDWEIMKDRVDWVILRCGYGSDYTYQDDLRWEYNASRCDELGIPYGVYLYSYADSTEKAASEAQHALRLLKGHHPQLPVYYDLEEDEIARRVPKTLFLEMSKIFCEQITAAGFEFGVYANLNWWNHYLTDPWYDGYSRWMAVYRDVFFYDGEYDIWQYTSTGKIEGFDGIFDLNHAYRPFDLQSRPRPTEPATAPIEPATVPAEPTTKRN